MQVTCSCGKILNVPDKLAGKTARCPTCKKLLQMPGAAPAGPAASRIMIECPCGKKLAAPASAAGKKVACPKCNKELTVPGPAKKPSSVPPGGSERGAPVITPMPGPASYKSAPTRPAKLAPASTEDLSFDVEAPPPEPRKPAPAPMDAPDGGAAHEEYGLGKPKCPNCKADLPHGAQFCVECGTALATGTKMQAAAPGVVKKKSLKDFKFSDLDPEDWRKIKYGAIAAIVIGLGYWYMYWPHGKTQAEMKQEAADKAGPPRAPGMGMQPRAGKGRGNMGD